MDENKNNINKEKNEIILTLNINKKDINKKIFY